MSRALTAGETLVIRRIAGMLLEESRRNQLLADLPNATATSTGDNGSRIVFDIAGYDRPKYRGQHSFGVEGEVKDKDGTRIMLDLYADEDGRLLELELIREEFDGKIISPDWDTLKLY